MNKDNIKNKIISTLNKMSVVLEEKKELSSLDLIAAAVNLEKAFNIQFDLDEITLHHFKTLDSVAHLIYQKLNLD